MTVAVSGGFDPVHKGHIAMFKAAKEMGDELVVILNCDDWLIRKKGKPFMHELDRKAVLESIRYVDRVYIHQSNDNDVVGALQVLKPDIFCNGGDRGFDNTPEIGYCMDHGIYMKFNVGGEKVESSSRLLDKYKEYEI